MKKIITLFLLLCLFSCSNDNKYFSFFFDGYCINVGKDRVEDLKDSFEIDAKEQLDKKELLEDIEMKYYGRNFALISISNAHNKTISSDKAIISSFTYYFNDLPFNAYKIDGVLLSDSIKDNCDRLNGNYIQKNGYACLLVKKNSVLTLYGDFLNINQDLLDHLQIVAQ